MNTIVTKRELVGFTPRQGLSHQPVTCHGIPIPPIIAVTLVCLTHKRLPKMFFAAQAAMNALDTVLTPV